MALYIPIVVGILSYLVEDYTAALVCFTLAAMCVFLSITKDEYEAYEKEQIKKAMKELDEIFKNAKTKDEDDEPKV